NILRGWVRLRSVRRDGAALAQKIKLLAHDSKPGADSLLNLVCRSLAAGVGLLDWCRGIFSRFRTGMQLLQRCTEVLVRYAHFPGLVDVHEIQPDLWQIANDAGLYCALTYSAGRRSVENHFDRKGRDVRNSHVQ